METETMLALGVAALWLHALLYLWHLAWQGRRQDRDYRRLLERLDEANATVLRRDADYSDGRRQYEETIRRLKSDYEARIDAMRSMYRVPRPDASTAQEDHA